MAAETDVHDGAAISKAEVKATKAQLADCEARIETGLRSFAEIGSALEEIRDGQLYRLTHKTFEDYVTGRWEDIGRAHAYRFIEAAQVIRQLSLSPIGDKNIPLPAAESHARALAAAPEPVRAEVWARAWERTEGRPTAKAVAAAVAEAAGSNEEAKATTAAVIKTGGEAGPESAGNPAPAPEEPQASEPGAANTSHAEPVTEELPVSDDGGQPAAGPGITGMTTVTTGELAELKAENARLSEDQEKTRAELREAVRAEVLAELAEKFETAFGQLTAERDALAAQVAELEQANGFYRDRQPLCQVHRVALVAVCPPCAGIAED